jgi:6-pyruvoyltetrahydropterin/6-carboxytetrahydropterin synthase
MAKVVKRFKWEAAHQLPNHFGKCANLHGHSYECEVELGSTSTNIKNPFGDNSDAGMVVDFYEIGEVMSPLVEKYLDHHFLNETLVDSGIIPVTTAEMIAVWIFEQVWARQLGVPVVVRVWETRTSYAEVEYRDWAIWCQQRSDLKAELESGSAPSGQ